jgi:hypothetical protein
MSIPQKMMHPIQFQFLFIFLNLLMAYSKAKLKSNGDVPDHSKYEMHTYMDFTTGFI